MASALEMLRDDGLTRYVKQKPKGVLLECCCWHVENEFGIGKNMTGWSLDGTDNFYITESSDFCCRFCFGAFREARFSLTQGGQPGGAAIANYHRPFRCGVAPCKCCCYQEIEATDATTGAPVGTVRETCWYCIPNFRVYDSTGAHIYDVHQPTCCLGLAVNCCDKGGAGCCKVPFYFYPPGSDEDGRTGKVIKVWTGLAKECCTLANNFEVEPPKGADGAQMALTYAATVLIDMMFFEGGGAANN